MRQPKRRDARRRRARRALKRPRPRLILLTGMPAAGKTFFGEWLEREHGYLHLDVEVDGVLERAGLAREWAAIFQEGRAHAFVDAVRRKGRDVVVNWGFPPRYLNQVELLKDAGFDLWWLDADVAAARRAFHKRGSGSLAAFDRQVAAIAASEEAIADVVEVNALRTLDMKGRRLRPKTIFLRLTRKRATTSSAALRDEMHGD